MFSCNLHEFSGFGDACPKCLKELAERHASKTESEFPTKPAAPEWDSEVLPPVGFTEKDCELAGVEGFHQGFEVVAHKGVAAIVWGPYDDDPEGQVETLLASHFRPIRTKEQRQKDDLADLIEKHQMENGSFCTPGNTAEAILSSYNLEPKL